MTRAMTARVGGGRGAMRRARRGRDHYRMFDTYCVGLGQVLLKVGIRWLKLHPVRMPQQTRRREAWRPLIRNRFSVEPPPDLALRLAD